MTWAAKREEIAAAQAAKEKAREEFLKKVKDASKMEGAFSWGSKGGIDINSLTFDDAHINSEREHGVTRDMALSYIRNARLTITRNGQ